MLSTSPECPDLSTGLVLEQRETKFFQEDMNFQGRMQDFTGEGRREAPTHKGDNLIFGQNFPINCMEMEKTGPGGDQKFTM